MSCYMTSLHTNRRLDLLETRKLGAKLIDIPIEQNDALDSDSNELLYDFNAYQ